MVCLSAGAAGWERAEVSDLNVFQCQQIQKEAMVWSKYALCGNDQRKLAAITKNPVLEVEIKINFITNF